MPDVTKNAALDGNAPNYYSADFHPGTILILVDDDTGKQTNDYSINIGDLSDLVNDVDVPSLQYKADTWSRIAGVLDEMTTHLNNSLQYLEAAKWTGKSAEYCKKHITRMQVSAGNIHYAGMQLSESLTTLAGSFGHVQQTLGTAAQNPSTYFGDNDGTLAEIHKSLYTGVNRALGEMPANLATNIPGGADVGPGPGDPSGPGLPGGGNLPGWARAAHRARRCRTSRRRRTPAPPIRITTI